MKNYGMNYKIKRFIRRFIRLKRLYNANSRFKAFKTPSSAHKIHVKNIDLKVKETDGSQRLDPLFNSMF